MDDHSDRPDRAGRDAARPGFYVAQHPWMTGQDSSQMVKVGFSGDLRRRLTDDAYVTCFPPGWKFLATFETRTREDAGRLEAGMLECLRERRVRRENGVLSELVQADPPAVIALVPRVSEALEIDARRRDNPVYDPPARAPAASGVANSNDSSGSSSRGDEAVLTGADRARLDGLKLEESPPEPTVPFEDLPATDETLDGMAVSRLEDEMAMLAEHISAPSQGAGTLEERAYQTEAVEACVRELDKSPNGRTILQMACRCGKTRVAHGVALDRLANAGTAKILFLVPGLALMRQTAAKLDSYGFGAGRPRLLMVGSDGRPVENLRAFAPGGGASHRATTNEDEIKAAVSDDSSALIVVSTYQSSELLPDAFDLTIFDECHRICGGKEPRPFTHVLLEHRAGRRLFMTATPRYDSPLSMKDRELFGGIAYAYHLRRGIDAGYVNDFSLDIVGEVEGETDAGAAKPKSGARAGDASAAQVVAAYRSMVAPAKLLVFCRSIRHAAELCVETATLFAETASQFAGAAQDGPAPVPATLQAHSRMTSREVGAALRRFCEPGVPGILFNCRLFQEGVEIPALNGVMFASPRHSPRDIIQTLCRPLNAAPDKPPSKVFIPVTLGPPQDRAGGSSGAEDATVSASNLQRFASIVPFFDALIAEDPDLYEHLLDPVRQAYPMTWISSSPKLGEYEPLKMLAVARRVVRRGATGKVERLLRAARIPWEIGFGELERIVRECGRYPKTTDAYEYSKGVKMNFNQFYQYARKSYAAWRAGEEQPLEPHQLRALESLPGWDPYGIEGPYPWRETLDFLEDWLREHDGVPPAVEINCGGYVGLEATPMERLSGTLTCINQADGRDRRASRGAAGAAKAETICGSGLTLAAEKQKDLDDLCERWGLTWRKARKATPDGRPGSLEEDEKGNYAGPKTFIQAAHDRFKAEWATRKDKSEYIQRWYPGYPLKHRRQERADVWAKRGEVVPPRWRGRGRAPRTEFDATKSIFL